MTKSDEFRVTLAAIAGAHGLGGEVRLKLFTEDLGRYKTMDAGGRTLTLVKLRPDSKGAVARFAEIGDRTAAENMRGTALTITRDQLPALEEGEYYHADLIGLPCTTSAGAPIGILVAIENFGAGDVIEIEKPDGKRFMIPLRAPAVSEWSPSGLVVDEAFVE